MADDSAPAEMVVTLQLPTFWANRPIAWFTHVEAQFSLRRIQAQETKANLVIVSLPENVMEDVADVLEDPAPNLYDRLKAALIKRVALTDQQRVQELFRDVQLGDRTPSQMLRHMKQLVAEFKIDDAFMKQLWLQRLPQSVQGILAPFYQSSIAELAEAADRAVEVTKPSTSLTAVLPSSAHSQEDHIPHDFHGFDIRQMYQEICNLRRELRSRSRSRSVTFRSRSKSNLSRRPKSSAKESQQGICWYHRRYGAKARKCTTPCAFNHSQAGNL